MKTAPIKTSLWAAGLGAMAGLAATTAPVLAAGTGAHAARAPRGSVALRAVRVSSQTLTVQGSARLPGHSAAARQRARVRLTLSDASRHSERRAVKLTAVNRFALRWTTQLTGRLTLRAQLTIDGKPYGRAITRQVTVAGGTSGSSTAQGTRLIGTFKLAAGSAPAGQAPTGSYFEMLQPNGAPLANQSSSAPNKDYTPLSPGSDGGLRTDTYQPAPNPAFSGGSSGDARADRIIQPTQFYFINFGIETSSTDAQDGLQDPLPLIANNNGKLSGQITAWVAQWNGQSFNQGTPKPDGSLPAPTTPLSGTYDSATHAFTLAWKSLIVGGPFNGFTGVWHLTGSFVAAAAKSVLPVALPG